MNQIELLFKNITDEELRKGIIELQEDGKLGIYRENGILRKYAFETTLITGQSTSGMLFLTETMLYKEASYRWVK